MFVESLNTDAPAIVASGIHSEFSAHCTREASLTAAAMIATANREVMDTAGWYRQNAFCKHYFRPLEQVLVATKYAFSHLAKVEVVTGLWGELMAKKIGNLSFLLNAPVAFS